MLLWSDDTGWCLAGSIPYYTRLELTVASKYMIVMHFKTIPTTAIEKVVLGPYGK